MRKKASETWWETNILGFIGRIKAGWRFLTFGSIVPSFLCKGQRRLPSTENAAIINGKEKTGTKLLLCTKHFVVTVSLNTHANPRGLAMLSLFYNWEYQPKSPFEQEETLPKSYSSDVKPDNVCDESRVQTFGCPRNWSNILPFSTELEDKCKGAQQNQMSTLIPLLKQQMPSLPQSDCGYPSFAGAQMVVVACFLDSLGVWKTASKVK